MPAETPVCTCQGEGGECAAHALRVDMFVGDKVAHSAWIPATDYNELAEAQAKSIMKPARAGKHIGIRVHDPDLDPDLQDVELGLQALSLDGSRPPKHEVMSVLLMGLNALHGQMVGHWHEQMRRKLDAQARKDRQN